MPWQEGGGKYGDFCNPKFVEQWSHFIYSVLNMDPQLVHNELRRCGYQSLIYDYERVEEGIMYWEVTEASRARPQVNIYSTTHIYMHFPYRADSFFLHRRSRAAAQEVPPELLQFRYWLAVWSENSAKLQDANEKKRYAAILEDGLNGAYAYNQQGGRKPKSKTKPKSEAGRYRQKMQAMTEEQKNAAKEKDRLRKRPRSQKQEDRRKKRQKGYA
jgi:hypothetical protein